MRPFRIYFLVSAIVCCGFAVITLYDTREPIFPVEVIIYAQSGSAGRGAPANASVSSDELHSETERLERKRKTLRFAGYGALVGSLGLCLAAFVDRERILRPKTKK